MLPLYFAVVTWCGTLNPMVDNAHLVLKGLGVPVSDPLSTGRGIPKKKSLQQVAAMEVLGILCRYLLQPIGI